MVLFGSKVLRRCKKERLGFTPAYDYYQELLSNAINYKYSGTGNAKLNPSIRQVPITGPTKNPYPNLGFGSGVPCTSQSCNSCNF